MTKIEIETEVGSVDELVDLLNYIATKIKEGFTSGYHPHWKIIGDNEE